MGFLNSNNAAWDMLDALGLMGWFMNDFLWDFGFFRRIYQVSALGQYTDPTEEDSGWQRPRLASARMPMSKTTYPWAKPLLFWLAIPLFGLGYWIIIGQILDRYSSYQEFSIEQKAFSACYNNYHRVNRDQLLTQIQKLGLVIIREDMKNRTLEFDLPVNRSFFGWQQFQIRAEFDSKSTLNACMVRSSEQYTFP